MVQCVCLLESRNKGFPEQISEFIFQVKDIDSMYKLQKTRVRYQMPLLVFCIYTCACVYTHLQICIHIHIYTCSVVRTMAQYHILPQQVGNLVSKLHLGPESYPGKWLTARETKKMLVHRSCPEIYMTIWNCDWSLMTMSEFK